MTLVNRERLSQLDVVPGVKAYQFTLKDCQATTSFQPSPSISAMAKPSDEGELDDGIFIRVQPVALRLLYQKRLSLKFALPLSTISGQPSRSKSAMPASPTNAEAEKFVSTRCIVHAVALLIFSCHTMTVGLEMEV